MPDLSDAEKPARFRINALPHGVFAPLWVLHDDELAARGVRRVIAQSFPGYPCRVSLQDAEPGEELLLLNYEHHAVHSPFRASGPIFVRRLATTQARPDVDDVPALLQRRTLSLRAYDAAGIMQHAELCEGMALDARLRQVLAMQGIRYLHLHNAQRGCFLASAEAVSGDGG